MTPQNPKQSQPEPRQGRESQPTSSNPQRSGEQSNPQRSGESSNPQRSGQANPQSTGGQSAPQRTGSEPQRKGSESQRTGSQPLRYDDRPQVDREDVQREENEGPAGQSTKSREQRRDESTSGSDKKTGTGGTPSYGDREPGDPRRSDVEGGKPGREGSESEA